MLKSYFGLGTHVLGKGWIALLMALTALCSTAVFAQGAGGEAHTYALPKVAPTEYNGDLRHLPPSYGPPRYVHIWNEFEGPAHPKPAKAPVVPRYPVIATAPMPGANTFAGLGYSDAVSGGQAGAGIPPDTNGDVGPTVYIQSVNDAYAIYDKATGAQLAAFTEDQLWSVSGATDPCLSLNQGDPVVLHDNLADRWILTNFAFAVHGSKPAKPFYQCFAVSKSSDPVSGGWWFYAIQMDTGLAGQPPTGALNDYGKFGLWNDGCLYGGFNEFTSTYVGAAFASYNTVDMYAGAPLTSSLGMISYSNGNPFSMFPANLLGTSAGSMPPVGTPEYFVTEEGRTPTVFGWVVRKFTPGANCGAGGTMSAPISVSQGSYLVNTTTSDFVPQKNTTQKLDTLEDRIMQKVQYRKIGSAESLWVVHTVGDGSAGNPAQPQWAQLDVTGAVVATTPVQEQIYAPDSTMARWMGSLAIDGQGNMALGYSTSSATEFPGIAYSGRLVGDPLNQLPQTEVVFVAGSGSQTSYSRWGDYSSMSVDPVDDCTFWYTTEYLGATGVFNWSTRIGSFKFPGCGNGKLNQTITFPNPGPVTYSSGATFALTATASSGLAVSYTSTTLGVCTVSGSTATIVSAGTCTIKADQAGNATYNAAPTVTDNITISKAGQTITFPNPGPVTYSSGGTFALGATASSGLAVSYTSTTTGVCTVSGSTATIVSAGTCTIKADQAGNTNYNAAPQVSDDITISKANQTITFTSVPPGSATVGGTTYNVTATGGASGNAVTFTIDASASSVCSISGGSVSFIGIGTCVIDANQTGNANYNAAPQAQQSFAVGKGSQTITFPNPGPVTYSSGGTFALGATASSGLAVSYTSTTTGVCTVSGSTATIVTAGTCTIQADQAGNTNYNAAPQVSDDITISKAGQTITFPNPGPVTYSSGGTFALGATASSTLAVSYTSTTTGVCTVAGSTVTIVTAGTCTIKADQAGNTNYNAAPQVSDDITISKAGQTITFPNPGPLTYSSGGTFALGATASSGLTVSYTSTTLGVCTVSGTNVTIVTAGTCTIKADQAGNANYNAAPQVSDDITISKAGQTITFPNPGPVTYSSGGTFALGATASSTLAVSYTSTTLGVCTVSGTNVTIVTAGTCTIKADQAGNANYNAAPQVSDDITISKAAQAINFTSSAPVAATVGGATYDVTASGGASGNPVTFTIGVSASSVCSISGSTVSFIGAGTCVIDANQAGDTNYSAAPEIQQSFDVGKTNQTITFPNPGPVTYSSGGTFALGATASSGLAVSYTSTTLGVCTVSGSVATIVTAGTCTIKADQAGNTNYNAAPQVGDDITIGKASQTINFTSVAPGSAAVGGPTYDVSATGGASGNPVTFAIDATASTVCSISGSTVSFIGSGTCVIDADQAGNANYDAATQVQQTFDVGKTNQTITFPNPGPVTYSSGGSFALGATASSGLAVTYVSTTAGVCTVSGSTATIVSAGTCTIKADQAGSGSYNAAPQVSDDITIGKGSQTINFTSAAPASAIVGGATYNVTATGGASGNPVTFAIDASASTVCSISGSTVSFIGAGACLIDANQAGSTNYNAASQKQQSFTVGKADQTINFTSIAPAGATVGGATYNVTATGGASGNPVTFTIHASASTVCSISGSTVSFVSAGTCLIDANQAGNANYNAAPQKQQSVTVGKANQTITFTSTAPSNAKVGGATYNVTATATSALTVVLTIEASASSVCLLSGSTVSFIGTGTCLIDANQAGNANYNAAPQKQQSFAVSVGAPAKLVFIQQPTNAAAGAALSPAVQVQVQDALGNPVTTDANGVQLNVSGPGPFDPGSTTFAAFVNGVATFSNLKFDVAGTGYKLTATDTGDGGLTVDSATFNISAGAPFLVFTQSPTSLNQGDQLGTVQVTEKDSFGNVIAVSGSVDFSIATACGTVDLGTAPMSGGVATLNSTQRFYTVTANRQIAAAFNTQNATSSTFAVLASGILFADGFECRP